MHGIITFICQPERKYALNPYRNMLLFKRGLRSDIFSTIMSSLQIHETTDT